MYHLSRQIPYGAYYSQREEPLAVEGAEQMEGLRAIHYPGFPYRYQGRFRIRQPLIQTFGYHNLSFQCQTFCIEYRVQDGAAKIAKERGKPPRHRTVVSSQKDYFYSKPASNKQIPHCVER